MKELIVLISLSVALLSCKSKSSTPATTLNQPATYKVSVDSPHISVDLCDAIEDMSFVELESNDTSMITNVSKVLLVDSIYYVMDRKFVTINRYDKTGRLLGSVGSLGADKDIGEYFEVQDMIYRPRTRTIWVYSNGYSSILEFALEGKFLRRIRTDLFASSMAATDSLYYYYINNNTSKFSQQYNVVITDTLKRVRERLFPMPKSLTASIAFSGTVVSGAGYILLNPLFNNIIYKMEGTRVTPEYDIDFGRFALPEEVINTKNVMEMKINQYGYLKTSIAIVSDVLAFGYLKNRRNSWAFFNPRTNHVALRKDTSIFPESLVFAKFNESAGRIFTSLPNGDALLKLEPSQTAALAARFPSYRASLEKIRDPSSPLLVSIKVKHF